MFQTHERLSGAHLLSVAGVDFTDKDCRGNFQEILNLMDNRMKTTDLLKSLMGFHTEKPRNKKWLKKVKQFFSLPINEQNQIL